MNLEKLKDTARKYEQKEDWRKALEVYLKAVQEIEAGRETHPDLSLYNRIGDLYLKTNDPAAAVRAYERAVDLYADQGFLNNAIALCGKILRVNPGRTGTYLKLAQLHARKNVVYEAKKNLIEYIERMNATSQLDEAFAAVKEFADQFSTNQDIRLMLVELLRAAHRDNEAKEQLEKLALDLEARGDKSGARKTRERMEALEHGEEPPPPAARKNDLVFIDTGFHEVPPRHAAPAPHAPPNVKAAGTGAAAAPSRATPAPLPAIDDDMATAAMLDHAPPSDPVSGLVIERAAEAAPPEPSPLGGLEVAQFGSVEVGGNVAPLDGLIIEDAPTVSGAAAAPPADLQLDRVGSVELTGAGAPLDGLERVEPVELSEEAVGDRPADDGLLLADVPLDGLVATPEPGQAVELDLLDAELEPADELDLTPEPVTGGADSDAAAPADGPDGAVEIADFDPVYPDGYAETAPPSADAAPGEAGGDGLTFIEVVTDGAPPEDTPAAVARNDDALGATLDEPLDETLDETLDSEPAAGLAPAPTVEELEDRILDDPENPSLHRQLADALLAAGELTRGIDELDLALISFEGQQHWADALDVADRLVRLDPKAVHYYQKRVELAYHIGDRARLLDSYLDLGDLLVRIGAVDKALAVYNRVVEHDPTNLRAQNAIGALSFAEVEPDPAEVPVEAAAESAEPGGAGATQSAPPPAPVESRAPAPPAMPPEIRRSGMETAPPPAAPPDTAAAPAAHPPRRPAAEGDGSFVDLGSMILDAEGPRDKRMKVEQEQPTGDEQRDFEEMLHAFKKGIEENLSAEDYEAHYDLGVAFKEMGLLDEAIAEFQKALRTPDREGRLRTSEALGTAFFEKGQHAIAEAVLRRAVDGLDGGDDEKIGLIYWLGRASEAQGKSVDARTSYERALAVDIRFMDVGERIRHLAAGSKA
jgi:tetratricopeptide (TPR) repeat protein